MTLVLTEQVKQPIEKCEYADFEKCETLAADCESKFLRNIDFVNFINVIILYLSIYPSRRLLILQLHAHKSNKHSSSETSQTFQHEKIHSSQKK